MFLAAFLFLPFFLVLIDDRRLLSIKTKLGLNRCLSQGTKAVSQLLDAKIQHFGIISGHSGHGNFRSKSFGGCHVPSEFAGFNKNNKSEKSMEICFPTDFLIILLLKLLP